MNILNNFIAENIAYIATGLNLIREYWWIYIILGAVLFVIGMIVLFIMLARARIGF